MAEAATGRFCTAAEVGAWVAERFGVAYTVSGMHQLLRRLCCKPKIPRPLAEKASLEEQDAWKKGGAPPPSVRPATTALAWADELRLGLHGRVRRVWVRVGIKVRPRVQLRYEWHSLSLAVAVLRGRLWWQWHATMRKEAIAPVVAAWQRAGLAALVWDGAPAHRAKLVRAVGVTLLTQPPAAPELNPVERVFQELRRAVEGLVYASLEEKVAAVEAELEALAADPVRLQHLVGWDWITDTLAQLPAAYPLPS